LHDPEPAQNTVQALALGRLVARDRATRDELLGQEIGGAGVDLPFHGGTQEFNAGCSHFM
jgi:hypothetical protein